MYYDYCGAQERSLQFAQEWRRDEPIECPDLPCVHRFNLDDPECAVCDGNPMEYCCRYEEE